MVGVVTGQARRGDVVRVHPHTIRDGRDLGGTLLTATETPDHHIGFTEYTGGPLLDLAPADVDLVFHQGALR